MRWVEVEILTGADAYDAINEKLIILGAYGITVEDPGEIASIISGHDSLVYADEGFMSGLGTDSTIHAYFAEFPEGISLGIKDSENEDFPATDILYSKSWSGYVSVTDLISLVAENVTEVGKYLDIAPGTISWKYVDDDDWAHSWKKYYVPIKISDRVVISPSWIEYSAHEGETIVNLDPGSAFGTGGHATTLMCADLLDKELFKRDTGCNVLDLGCGSGILAIIAAKLGASHVDAIDIDPVAVKVTQENSSLNNVQNIVNVFRGDIKVVSGKTYDIVVANIIADVIISIAKDVKPLLKSGGVFIASGIICTKRDMVLDACTLAGFKCITEERVEDWVAFLFG